MTPSQPDPADRRLALNDFAARSRHAQRRAQLDQAAAEAIVALDGAGVEALLLKGAGLAQALYGPDRERAYFDIDLLVAPDSLPTVDSVLSELGYRNIMKDQGIDDLTGVVHAALWTRLGEFGNVSLDLHWKLAGCDASAETIWTALRRDAVFRQLGDWRVLTSSEVGFALQVALHLAQHGRSDAKAVADLRLALISWSAGVWEQAAALASELDALETFAAGLRLLPEGEIAADALKLGTGEQVLWDLEHRESRPRGTFHLDALSRAVTFRQRLAILRRALFPPTEWIRWEMPWASRSPAALAAGYLVHLLRTPRWALRAALFRSQRPS